MSVRLYVANKAGLIALAAAEAPLAHRWALGLWSKFVRTWLRRKGLPALVQVESSGGKLLFEGDASEIVLREMAVGDKVKDIVTTTQAKIADVGSTISACTRDLLSVFDDLATDKRGGGSFSSAVIELGVKITAEGNVVVARGTVEANLKVTLNWDFS